MIITCFLYVDDLANLCVFLMNNYSGNLSSRLIPLVA